MTPTVHSVNARGSDEYSIHVVMGGDIRVVGIFRKGDKRRNRSRAVQRARIIAANLCCEALRSHNLTDAAFFALLPENCRPVSAEAA